MTVRYVASTGSNTSPYDTWAKAAPVLKTVTDLMGAGDITYVLNETVAITVDTVYTIAGTSASPAMLISTSDTANAPPTTVAVGALINGSATAGVDISIAGKCYMYGMQFTSGGAATIGSIKLGGADDSSIFAESCTFTIGNTNGSSVMSVGEAGTASTNARVTTKNCTFTMGNAAGQLFQPANYWESCNDTFGITTTVPTTYFGMLGTNGRMCNVRMEGADLSAITTTLISATAGGASTMSFYGCKLGSGVAVMATQTGPGHTEAWLYDCNVGDVHYDFAHYNYWGNTTISTAIYMSGTDGASYDAANNKHSWKITGVNGSYATPYKSPWVSVYNEAVAAVTPRLEVLRDGSTTAYNNDEVWAEFSAKITTGFPLVTLDASDKRGLVAAAAAQTSSALGAADWVGETTPWYGKLEPTATITPAEVGHIRARVCVVGANTLYVNPKILGV